MIHNMDNKVAFVKADKNCTRDLKSVGTIKHNLIENCMIPYFVIGNYSLIQMKNYFALWKTKTN